MSNSIYKILITGIVLIFAISCKENGTQKETLSKKSDISASSQQLEPLPRDIFMKLYNECDYLDVIFMDLPFSMSQDDNNSVRNLLSHVDKVVPDRLDPNCRMFGQQVYQKNGEILAEANLYVSPGCNYFIFSIEGKKYYNKMMPSGIDFYENLKKQKIN